MTSPFPLSSFMPRAVMQPGAVETHQPRTEAADDGDDEMTTTDEQQQQPPPIVSYDKPVPRQARTHARTEEVRVRNRRREYLERNPSYFQSLEHELADPAMYERLVKRFQSAPERAAEGEAKGYGRTLEASLVRGENRLAELAQTTRATGAQGAGRGDDDGDGADEAWDGEAADREHGLELWRSFLEDRFVGGGDDDFDYAPVDGDEELDAWERHGEEQRWFEDEEPGWASGREGGGETGVQDY